MAAEITTSQRPTKNGNLSLRAIWPPVALIVPNYTTSLRPVIALRAELTEV